MAYEKYKHIKTKEEFYKEWEHDKLAELTDKLREYIYTNAYNKYVVKCQILQRDKFTCQNTDGEDGRCIICKNAPFYPALTWHHIKAQRNKGEHKVRNGVTLCKGSHQRYEKAKGRLVFSKDSINLPPHIRGHTFKLDVPKAINWKRIRIQMKALRKELKSQGLKPLLNWEEIAILMRWLFIPYYEFDEDDEDDECV